jgi:hypothetical protein
MNFLTSTLLAVSLSGGATLDVTPDIPKDAAKLTRDYVIARAFSFTPLKERIVSVSFKEKKSVVVSWCPEDTSKMLEDMLIILETVHETYPDFDVVSLQAVSPACKNKVESVIWKASITRNSFALLQQRQKQNSLSTMPTPLYRQ